MKEPKSRQLPVRVRRTLHGDGAATSACTVSCPTHGEAVALSVCADCVRCERIAIDGSGGKVECRPETSKPLMRFESLVHRILPSAADRVAISSLMTNEVTCVTRDVSVETVTALFLERGFGAVPVVDDEGFPIGVLSKTDLVRDHWERGDTTAVARSGEVADGMHVEELPRAVVGDLMTPLAYTLREDDPLSRAAAVMQVEAVHHLPVVSADGRIVGMLSSLDFVRWVAAQSAFANRV
jgi:CBS domain-containing protein